MTEFLTFVRNSVILLRRNLKYLRKQKGNTQAQTAKAVGITRTALADYENGKSEPKASVLIKFAAFFDINIHDLLNTDIDTPLFKKSKAELKSIQNRDLRVVAITVQENQKQNIEFVPVSAVAGYAQSFDKPEYIKDLPRFTLPKLYEGTYRAFEIKGNSMPPIDENFIVIGQYVEHFSELKNGKRYVFILKENGVVFKRVINEVSKNKRLILVSDNPEYQPYSVKISDVLEVWEMVSFIGYPTKELDIRQAILDKLQTIEQRLEQLSV